VAFTPVVGIDKTDLNMYNEVGYTGMSATGDELGALNPAVMHINSRI